MTAIDTFSGANDGLKTVESLFFELYRNFGVVSCDFESRVANFAHIFELFHKFERSKSPNEIFTGVLQWVPSSTKKTHTFNQSGKKLQQFLFSYLESHVWQNAFGGS